uniref:Uncharacterized protein n=2 Tax=Rhodnius prolixus TaxID=13249 RepID=T1I4G9_RHOPR
MKSLLLFVSLIVLVASMPVDVADNHSNKENVPLV